MFFVDNNGISFIGKEASSHGFPTIVNTFSRDASTNPVVCILNCISLLSLPKPGENFLPDLETACFSLRFWAQKLGIEENSAKNHRGHFSSYVIKHWVNKVDLAEKQLENWTF